MKIVVVVPTYNERENIQRLIPRIGEQRGLLDQQLELLVVDDNSPDGTADAVRELQRGRPWLHLITGQKEGLGRAYIRGMSHALDVLGADAVMEMDADFSHQPADLPRLIAGLDAGYDFIIGSRYVPGGSIPASWGPWRRANSRYGNVAARVIAGMREVRDCTAGFRCIRAEVLRRIGLETIRANGYCFQVELLHKCLRSGARIQEVPVDFVDRTVGDSKLGLSDIVEFLVAVWRIRLGDSAVFMKFCAVGASGVVVNLGALALLTSQLAISEYLASPMAIQLSIMTNFLLNNAWTFRGRGAASQGIRALRFNLVSVLALAVSYGVFLAVLALTPLRETFGDFRGPLIAQAVGIIPATLVNYLLNTYWTWKS